MEEIKTPDSIKKHFDPNRDAKSLPLATSNGLFGAMTLVQLDDYPVAARVIKDLFQLSPQAIAQTLASYTPLGSWVWKDVNRLGTRDWNLMPYSSLVITGGQKHTHTQAM
jgi:hypothetical protein